MRHFSLLVGLLLVLPAISLATQLQTTTNFDPDAWTFVGANNEVLQQQSPTGANPSTVSFWFNAEKYGDYGNGEQGTLFARGTWLHVNDVDRNSGQMISLSNMGLPDNGDSTIPAQNFYTPSDYKTFNNNYQDLTLNVPQDGKPYKIEFWFNVKEYKTTDQGIQVFLSGGTHTDSKFLLIGLKDKNILIGHYANDWTTKFVPELNRWYKLVLVWDGMRESLYIDNKVVDSRQTFLNLKGTNFRMGAHAYAPIPAYSQYNDRIGDYYYYFSGSMTDVKVYDKIEQETYLRLGHWNNDWTTNFVPELKAWYYLTVTYDGATEKVYVNGVLADSKQIGSLNIQPSDIYLGSMIPHPYGWVSYYFNGKIGKDVKILSSALSDAEAAAAYEEAKDAATFPAVILPQETVYLYGYSDYSYYNSPHDSEYLRHIFYRTLVYEDGTREVIDSYNSMPDKGEMKINAYGSSGIIQTCGVWTGVEGSASYNFECWASYYVGYYDGIIPEKTVKISKPGNYRIELKDIILPPATAGRYPNITLQSTIDYWMDYDINAYKDGYTNCKENVYPNTGSTWHEHAFFSHCQGDKKLFSGIKLIDLPKDNPIFLDGTITESTPSFYDGMPKALHDTLKSYEFTVVQPVTIEGFKVCSNNDFNSCKPAKFANQPAYIFPIVKATNPYEVKIIVDGKTYTGTAAFTPKSGKYTLTLQATDLVNGDVNSQSQDLTFAPALVLATGKSKSPFEPAAGGSGGTATGAFPAIPLNGNTAVALLAGVGAVGAGYYVFKNKNNPSKLRITGLKTTLTGYGKQQDAAREGAKEQMHLAQKSLEAYKKWKEEQERASNSNGYYAKHYLSLLANAKSTADKKLYAEEAQKFLKATGLSTVEAKSVVKTFTSPSIFGSTSVAQSEYNKRVNEILSGKIISAPAKTEKKKGLLDGVTEGIANFFGGIVNGIAGMFTRTATATSVKKPLAGVKNTEANKENNNFKGFGGGKSGGSGAGRGYKDPFDKKILPLPLIAIATGAIATGAVIVSAPPVIITTATIFTLVVAASVLTNPNASKTVEGVLGQVKLSIGNGILADSLKNITPKVLQSFLPVTSIYNPVGSVIDVEFVNEDDRKGVKLYNSFPSFLLAATKLPDAPEMAVTEGTINVDKGLSLEIQTLIRHDNPFSTSFGIGLIAVKENMLEPEIPILNNK